MKLLEDNQIECFYHFTDERNLSSIRKGGLLSWYYCQNHGVDIPNQGGDEMSKSLDARYMLQDYVRLSFCRSHPMAYRLQQKGSKLVLLKIKKEVACFKETSFSTMNATDKLNEHGKNLVHLQKVDFEATKKNYLKSDDENFKPHQAEVMVKTFVPAEYIINLAHPQRLN